MAEPPLPFRLGATSYVYPADLTTNAARLAGQVDDIELILFDLPGGPSNLPDAAVVAALAALAEVRGLSYTVHLPLDLRHTPGARHPSLLLAERIIGLTAPLRPLAFVAHLDAEGVDRPDWTERGLAAISELLPQLDEPGRLALENLERYPPERLEPIFDALPIERALDIGHLWKAGRDPLPFLECWLPRCRLVHLHGLNGGEDHRSLALVPPARLDPVVARLLRWSGVVTLEVFSLDDLETSRRALLASLARLHRPTGP